MLDAEEPQNGFFFVSSVAPRVDADGREFASFAPAFDGEWGDSEDFGNFTDSE